MAKINEILEYLGLPYHISIIDKEPVVYRQFDNIEIEVSGLHKKAMNCTIYVWMTSPHRELMGIYSNIRTKENLKDLLGYCAVKYQNLLSQIHVEREDQIE